MNDCPGRYGNNLEVALSLIEPKNSAEERKAFVTKRRIRGKVVKLAASLVVALGCILLQLMRSVTASSQAS